MRNTRNTQDRDDGIMRLDFSDEFLLDSAEKRYESGDFMGALTMLNKRAGMYRPSADASALYADIYEALSLWIPCADAWFRFLDTCNEADFGEGYEGLSVAFANMGDGLRAELYYRRSFEASGETPPLPDYDEEERAPEHRPQLRLVHSDDGTVTDPELLHRGVMFVKTGELDKAREVLSGIYENAGPHIESSGSAPLKKVRAGEVAVGFGLRQQAAADKAEGLPVDFVDPAEGNFSLTESVAVVDKGEDTNPLAQEMAECIITKGRAELQKYYPNAVYEGETTDEANSSANPKTFPEPLTLDLLEKHQELSESCK